MNARIFLLLTALALAGCGGSSAPKLVSRETHHWPLPPEGNTLPAPRSVTFGLHGDCIVLDRNGRVLVFDEHRKLLRRWAMPDTSVGKPEGVVVLNDGRIVVCDTHYHQLVYFDDHGTVLGRVGKLGQGLGEFIYPVGIAKDHDENLYVCEYGGNDRVQKFTREGKFLRSFGKFGTGAGELQRPSGLAWREGKVYVADSVNNRLLVYADDGRYEGVFGAEGRPLRFDLPYGVVAAADSTLYVIEYGSGQLKQVSADGKLVGVFGGAGAGEEQFAGPWGLAVDEQRRVYVCDTGNRRMVFVQL